MKGFTVGSVLCDVSNKASEDKGTELGSSSQVKSEQKQRGRTSKRAARDGRTHLHHHEQELSNEHLSRDTVSHTRTVGIEGHLNNNSLISLGRFFLFICAILSSFIELSRSVALFR